MLGFENEAAAFVEVDAAGGDGAVALVELDVALEDVGVLRDVGLGGLGLGDSELIAELREEQAVVGPLGGGGFLPVVDEFVERFGSHGRAA